MTRCTWTDACPFFSDEVGYSLELQAQMRGEFCMGDNSHCARFRSLAFLPLNHIPTDLMPTDHERLTQLIDEFEREIYARRKAEDPDQG